MENEFLDIATRTTLAMTSALLLHHCDNYNRLHERREPEPRQNKDYHAPPMSDSYIDQLAASRTIHFSDTEPSRQGISQQHPGRSQNSFADLYHSRTIHIPDDSANREPSFDQPQPEESYHVIRSSRPAPHRRGMHHPPDSSYLQIPTQAASLRFSPAIERSDHLPGFYRPDEPIIAPIQLPTDRSKSAAARREITSNHYRSSRGGQISSLKSPSANFSTRPIMTSVSNLDNESFPNQSSSQLNETINTLINRINRQADIIQAGWQPTERLRIGIMRRSSDDYDAETGRMRSLEERE